MMKLIKVVYFCHLVLTLGITLVFGFAVKVSADEGEILYQMGFEEAEYRVGDELPESWEPFAEAGAERHVIVDKQIADAKVRSGQKAVLLDTTAEGGGNVIRYQQFPPAQSDVVSLELWVYTTPDGTRGATYYCSDDPDNAKSAIYVTHNTGGKKDYL